MMSVYPNCPTEQMPGTPEPELYVRIEVLFAWFILLFNHVCFSFFVLGQYGDSVRTMRTFPRDRTKVQVRSRGEEQVLVTGYWLLVTGRKLMVKGNWRN